MDGLYLNRSSEFVKAQNNVNITAAATTSKTGMQAEKDVQGGEGRKDRIKLVEFEY